MAQVLLADFNEIYNKSWEQEAEWKDLKEIQYGQKRSEQKVQVKEDTVAKEINTIEKKPSTLLQDNKKDALKVFQEWAIPHPMEAQKLKSVKLFQRVSFEKKAMVCPASLGLLSEWFLWDSFPHVQPSRYPEAVVAVVQRDPGYCSSQWQTLVSSI